jgi:hypothetical protein
MDFLKERFFHSEYRRASLAMTTSEAIRVGLLLWLDPKSPQYPQSVFGVSVFVLWLNYTLDIFVAKESFANGRSLPPTSTMQMDLFDHRYKKLNWYLNSFIQYGFVKYLVVILINYITTSVITTYFKKVLNEKKIGVNLKYRNIIIQWFVNSFSFGLYMYFLKFRWAYVIDVNYIITMVVLSWCSMSLIMYMIFSSLYLRPPGK